MNLRNPQRPSRNRELAALALTFAGALIVAALLLAVPSRYISWVQTDDMAITEECSDTTNTESATWSRLQKYLHDGFDVGVDALKTTLARLTQPFRRALGIVVCTPPVSGVPGTIITPYYIEMPVSPDAG